MCNPTNFVAAGLIAMSQHIKEALLTNPELLSEKSINNLFKKSVNKFLSSAGMYLQRGEPVKCNIIKKYIKRLTRANSYEFMKDCEFIIDSGGFQIQQGYISKEDIHTYIDLYHKFLHENDKLYHKAFTLDISFGPNYNPFTSWKDFSEFNYSSYGKSINLPYNIRKKMIYIHHFAAPKLYSNSKKMFNDLAINFDYFATGGIANSYFNNSLPCVSYTIPLIDVVNHALKNNIKKIGFHILGETEFKSLLVNNLMEYFIRKSYGLDITITYDSTTVLKTLAFSRFTYFLDENETIHKLPLTSRELQNNYKTGELCESIWYRLLNEMCSEYNMPNINPSKYPMYNNTGKYNQLFYTYSILQMFYLFKKTAEICENRSKILYNFIEDNDELGFSQHLRKYMISFNGGKDTGILNNRIINLYHTMEMLKKLDPDYNKYIVEKYMTKEENNLPE